jgi:hypothetical protein
MLLRGDARNRAFPVSDAAATGIPKDGRVCEDRGRMTPQDFTRVLGDLDDRLASVRTSAVALLVFAAVSAAAAWAGGLLDRELAQTSALFALAGAAGAAVLHRVLRWRREQIEDEILLAGYRHVAGADVGGRAGRLVSERVRGQLAATLERFLQCAYSLQPTAVPLNRRALRACGGLVRDVVAALRATEVPVAASGMVLLQRLLTDGATSPLFHPDADEHRLRRALEDIREKLAVGAVVAAA